jgi:hypothetical protein
MSKLFLSSLILFLSISLYSCENEPIGFRVTANRLQILCTEGKIKSLVFINENWVTAELTKESLVSKEFIEPIETFKEKNINKPTTEFKLVARIASINSFQKKIYELSKNNLKVKKIKFKIQK